MRLSCLERVRLKTREEVAALARAAGVAVAAVESVAALLTPGTRLFELERHAVACLKGLGARELSGFARRTVCTSVNEVAVHGVPDGRELESGDVVTVDVALRLDGWYGDAARTFVVGKAGFRALLLAHAANRVAQAAVAAARAGTPLGDISRAAVREAGRWGVRVAPSCVGHGIGRALHEDPEVSFAAVSCEEPLVPGMTVTIEPVVVEGDPLLIGGSDGAFRTADGGLSAHVEHTVVIFADRTESLDKPAALRSPPRGASMALLSERQQMHLTAPRTSHIVASCPQGAAKTPVCHLSSAGRARDL